VDLHVPVIGILRGIEADFFSRLADLSFAAGLQAIEVTMNTKGVLSMVEQKRPAVPSGRLLGMGTIRNRQEAEDAIGAGAMFLVTPNCDTAVIEYARSRDIPVVAGALTPTEVYTAWSAGAAMVKVFPCGSVGGSRYIKALRGPFDHIPLVAVGGVTMENLGEFFAAGAAAVGVSTALFGRQPLADQDLESVEVHVRKFIDSCPGTNQGCLTTLNTVE
jgi:2-dehydro-3-deoxyphosphogluconate aldolase/(4S)-4-hydroxy-2-oxoglutarate aldolase